MTCNRRIGPYKCCSVIQGDCVELLKSVPREILVCECGEDVSGEGGIFHVVAGHKNRAVPIAIITDPPYGIGIASNPIRQMHTKQQWDETPVSDEAISLMLSCSDKQIIWGGNYFDLPPSQGFLVWDKCQPEGLTLAMCEQAWCSFQRPAKMFRMSVLSYRKEHPTQKPVELMQWCIEQAGFPEIILDPFAGSGTTLVAAKKLGKHYLGFELSEEYCAIARKRLEAIEAQPRLFEPSPEQLTLLS